MDTLISHELETTLEYARDEAMRTGWYSICPDHLMLAIIRQGDNRALDALKGLGIDMPQFKKKLDAALFREHSVPYPDAESVNMSEQSRNAISLAVLEAAKSGQDEVRCHHLLLAILGIRDNVTRFLLEGRGTDREALTARMRRLGMLNPKTDMENIDFN